MDVEVNGLNKQGIQAALSGNVLDAEKYFKQALSLNSNSLDSIFNLVKLFYMQKRCADAIELYLQIIPSVSLADIPSPIISMLANCFADQSKFDQAIYLLEFNHHSHPLDVETSCQLSNLLIQNGRLAQAKEGS